MDNEVQNWVKKIRVNGVLSTQGLLSQVPRPLSKKKQTARYKLAKYGGHINITKYFAVSLLRRMGFAKKKRTKSVKHGSSYQLILMK